jgi:ABC-type multidrug transport system ATPase subunit
MGGMESKFYVPTFADAIVAFFLTPFMFIWRLVMPLLPIKPIPKRAILKNSSGALKPGEMCLVLGCPGAGCSTFLKTIANVRDGYAAVTGDVRYAGMDAQEMAKYYRGEVVYNEEGRSISPLTRLAPDATFR